MKKILSICFTLVMVFNLSISSFAAPGSFVISPSGNPTPDLVDGKIDGEEDWDCGAELVVTAYADREKLPSDAKETIEYAYDDIVMSDNLTELNDGLAKAAADKKINGKDLAVSDLFNIHLAGCQVHNHTGFEIVLEADTLDQFVGLLYMSEKGMWEFASNAQVINNGKRLKFSVDSLGSFAIVVKSTSHGDTPQTGDNSKIYVYAIVMAVSALALVVIIIAKKRKQKKQ